MNETPKFGNGKAWAVVGAIAALGALVGGALGGVKGSAIGFALGIPALVVGGFTTAASGDPMVQLVPKGNP